MTHITRFFRSFGHAFRGLIVAAKGVNFVVMVLLGAGAVALGIADDIKLWKWAAVALAIGFVLAMEAMNTALEKLADSVHPERHPGIRQAKDAAAAASLIASISALAVGIIVFRKVLF